MTPDRIGRGSFLCVKKRKSNSFPRGEGGPRSGSEEECGRKTKEPSQFKTY